jgi:hypothetical protein
MFTLVVQAQTGNFDKKKSVQSFEDFKKKQSQKFENYKKDKQLAFAKFLEQKWKEFELFAAQQPVERPKPIDPPVADPNDTVADVKMPVAPTIIKPAEEKPVPEPVKPIVPDNVEYSKIDIEFAGHNLSLKYDRVFNIDLPQITENKIAEYWTKMAKGSFEELVYQCLQIKKDLKLNDWGYYMFVNALANEIYSPQQKNEKVALTAFILDNSGYKIRMGRDEENKELVLLVASADQIYRKSFFVFSGEKYYLLSDTQAKSIYTYDEWKDGEQKKAINLIISQPVKAVNSSQTKMIKSGQDGNEIAIEYNPNLREFYDKAPFSDLAVYFNSECSENVVNSLRNVFTPVLSGKTKTEQVAALLRFIHEGMPYKTDKEQFGREKYFFYEETFMYPFTDCEDNAILFTYLVRKFTGLKTVGLLYHDHAAAAVRLDENIEGNYVVHNGDKYMICDPTYFGSRIGQAMPQYLNESAQIIEIK